MMSKEETEKLKQDLKERGYKLTPQRRAILNAIIDSEGRHLSPEEIYDLVKMECPEIGLATVYRTVQLLEKMGILYKMNFDDGVSRYELVHSTEDHQHHHLICVKCGDIQEVEDDLLDSLEEKITGLYNFKITNHDVKFYGICKKCK
ncbi:Fur family transcriptional regulator [Caloramator mitchellensis]|nr:Fur family transcriptional regulator [Caloramator mitchellensis]